MEKLEKIKNVIENFDKEILNIKIENNHKIMLLLNETIEKIEKIIESEEKRSNENDYSILDWVIFR